MIDKTAAAMAGAMGVKAVDPDANDDNKDTGTDGAGTDDKGTGTDDKGDGTDKGTGAGDDAAADDKGDGAGTDGDDKGSSGGQDNDDKGDGTDHADDKKVIPGTDNAADQPDQQAIFDTSLTERSKGRFKNMADIDKALEEAPQNAFANEQVAKINDYVKGGGTLQDYVRTQTTDYKEMTPIDIVRESRALDNPDLTSAEIDLLIEDDYGVAEDASERTKTIAGAKLKQESSVGRKKLLEHQQTWATPQGEKAASREVEIAKWEGQLNGAVDTVNEIVIPLNQTDSFTFKLEPEVKAKIKSDNKEIDKFFNRYVNADGSENTERFVRDMAILNNFETIVQAAAASSKSQGKGGVIKDLKNADFEAKDKKDGEKTTLTISEQAAKEFYKQG